MKERFRIESGPTVLRDEGNLACTISFQICPFDKVLDIYFRALQDFDQGRTEALSSGACATGRLL